MSKVLKWWGDQGKWLALAVVGFLLTRLPNLTKLPIFTDEAIYIRWSQIGAWDPAWRFISLTDGKQPWFTWVVMGLLRVIKDPLLAGRLASVIAGAGTAIGIYLLTRELFKKTSVAWAAVFLYIICPFTLLYDRLAVYDSWVAAFFIWSLYLSILLVRWVRLDVALIFGLMLGAGMMNKTSAFLSLYLAPFTLALFDWRKKNWRRQLWRWFLLLGLAGVLSQIVYSVLRLSPFFYIVAQKNTVFIYPFGEWIKHPLQFLWGNLNGLSDWLMGYLSWPILVAGAGAFLINVRKYWREKLLLLVFWLVPFVGLATFGKVLYPRFILFMSLPLLILAAMTLVYIWEKYGKEVWGWVLTAILIGPNLYASYFVVVQPIYAPIPQSDRVQLVDDWPAGGGIPEVIDYLKQIPQEQEVAVYTDGTFGLLPYALEIYLHSRKNIYIKGIWPLPSEMPEEIAKSVQEKDTYFILNQYPDTPSWMGKLIFSVPKGTNKYHTLRFHKIEPLYTKI